MKHLLAGLAVAVICSFVNAVAQQRPDPVQVMAAQREAMTKLSIMDGVWRGPAWTILPTGEKHNITQTERIGPFLGGSIKVLEGRGYDADEKSRSMLSARSLSILAKAFTPSTRMLRAMSVISFLLRLPMAMSGRSRLGQ